VIHQHAFARGICRKRRNLATKLHGWPRVEDGRIAHDAGTRLVPDRILVGVYLVDVDLRRSSTDLPFFPLAVEFVLRVEEPDGHRFARASHPEGQGRSLSIYPIDQRLRMVAEADIRAIFQIVAAPQRRHEDGVPEG
jgi:hypothetical protein